MIEVEKVYAHAFHESGPSWPKRSGLLVCDADEDAEDLNVFMTVEMTPDEMEKLGKDLILKAHKLRDMERIANVRPEG